jgi:hypothetical protein
MGKLLRNENTAFDIEPRDKSAHRLWSDALALQNKKNHTKSQKVKNLNDQKAQNLKEAK